MSGAVSLLPPYAFMAWTRNFFLIFHIRATRRAHHVVVMRILCSVRLPSLKFLPATTSRVHTFSIHTTLLSSPLSLLARPTMLRLFIVITMEDILSSILGKFNCPVTLLSRIPTRVVHMHATTECRGSGGIATHILKVGTRLMRVHSLTLRETPPQPGRRLGEEISCP